MSGSDVILEAVGIDRSYPGVHALKGVSLTLRSGEVTALMGENGAGKSTLIRIIGGLEHPNSGTLRLRGHDVTFRSPSESQQAGISVVSQEFRLVPQLTVAENIFLGREIVRRGFIRPSVTKQRARDLLKELGLDIEPTRMVNTLSVGDQQMVEIARALSNDFDVLVMDEPSAALNRSEVARLLGLVRRLRDRGKAILYVSHHLEEIFEIADRVAVFRDGRDVGNSPVKDTSQEKLVELMLGRELQRFESAPSSAEQTQATDDRLVIEDLRCAKIVEPVSLTVQSGEVVGVAGLVGSGRSEFLESLFGVIPSRGIVRVKGSVVNLSSPASAVKAGMFMLSENRKSEGILPHLSVLENLLISSGSPEQSAISRRIPMPREELGIFERLKRELRITVDRPGQYIGNLSGGNQQKVLFGRAMLSDCSVLLLNEPTRGVDVGAKVEIYQLIGRLAASGVAIIVSSSDTPEIVALTRRCLVFQGGVISAELTGVEVTEDRILAASVGTPTAVASR